MSAARQGGALLNEGRNMTEEFAGGVVTSKADQGGVQGGAQAVVFPRQFNAKDSRDDIVNMKQQMMDNQGMTPFGQVYFDDKDAKWLQRKEQAAEYANLDAWFGQNFNKNNLADRAFAQQIFPEYYTAREQEMARKAKAALELKLIQLRGPQSKEDMYKLWLIETGRVELPADWDRIGSTHAYDAAVDAPQFKQGLIHMPKVLSNAQRKTYATNNAGRNAWGSEAASVNAFGNAMTDIGTPPGNKPLARGAGTGARQAFNFLKQ